MVPVGLQGAGAVLLKVERQMTGRSAALSACVVHSRMHSVRSIASQLRMLCGSPADATVQIRHFNVRAGGAQSNGSSWKESAGFGGDSKSQHSTEPPSPPPSAMNTLGAMMLGAAGAVGIAAVGVWGVFHIAMAVASGAGRSILPSTEETATTPDSAEQSVIVHADSGRR